MMNKVLFVQVVPLSIIFILSLCVSKSEVISSEKNLLSNSGFEMDANYDEIPDGWELEGKEEFIKLDRRILRHKGKRSLKIVASDNPTGVYQFIPYDGKTKLYKISIWMKTNLVDTTMAHVGIDYYSKDDKFLIEEFSRPPYLLRLGVFQVCGKTGWKKYISFARRLPKKTAKIRVWCEVNTWKTPDAKGTAWFDDISIESVEPDPNWPTGYSPVQWKPTKTPSYSKKVKDSGYIVSVTNCIKYIVPDMTPEKGTDDSKISSFSFPSDYEPLTFCVHALKELKNVRVNVSDLTLSDRKDIVIPSKNIDVRRVFYLYKRLYYRTAKYIFSPLYLEEFDDVSIGKGKTQQFWLTVKVPEDAVCGQYKGSILISASNAPDKELKIEFDILPIKLLEPEGVFWGMYDYGEKKEMLKANYEDMRKHGMSSVSHCGDIGSKIERAEDGSIKIVWDYNKGLALTLDVYRDAAFPEPMMWLGAYDLVKISERLGDKVGTKEFVKVYRELLSQIIQKSKERNWPEIYFTPIDEGYPYGFGKRRIQVTRVCLKILKQMGLKTAAHSPNHPTPNAIRFAKEFYPLIDMFLLTFCHPPVCVSDKFPALECNWKEFRERTKKEGKNLLFYNVDNTGLRPEAMRFGYGVALWIKDAEGMFNWHYQHPRSKNCYNGVGRSHLPFYFSPNATHRGGPSLGWEAIREGVEDYKLLYTLDRLIKQAEKSTDVEKKKIARKAKKEVGKILSKINLSKLDSCSKCILPGKWEEERYGKDDVKEVSGDCKIPTGFTFDDYDRLRYIVCKYIIAFTTVPM